MPSEPIKRSQYFIPPTTECPHTSRNHFEDWEEYHLPMARLHHAHLHDSGVASGLEVLAVSETNEIEVQPGVAVDGSGELISLSALGEADISVNEPGEPGKRIVAPFRLSTAGHENQTRYLTVQFSQTPRLTEGSCGKLEQTPWLRLQASEGEESLANDDNVLVLAIVSVDAQGVPIVNDRTPSLTHRRRLLGQKLNTLQFQRTAVVDGTVEDVSSVQMVSDETGGLRVSLGEENKVLFHREGDGLFASFEVQAENVHIGGRLAVQGDAQFDENSVFEGKVSIGSSASDSRLTVGDGTDEILLQFNAGHVWNFNTTNEEDTTGLNLQALASDKSFRVLCEDGTKAALHVQTSNTAQKNAVYLTSSGGRVGVGTTDPNQSLTIEGTASNAFMNLRTTDSSQELVLGVDSSGGILSAVTNHDLRLGTGSSVSQLTIKANGHVGIGTSTPSEKLEVAGRLKVQNLAMGQWPAGSNYSFFGVNTLNQSVGKNYALLQAASGPGQGRTFLNSPKQINFRINNKDKMVLATSGFVGIGTTTPTAPLHIIGGGDVGPNRGGSLIIGAITGSNIAIDNNEIMARSNKKVSKLYIQNEGGDVVIGGQSGKVGVGTRLPQKTLDVRGDARVSGKLFVKTIRFANKRNMQWDRTTGELFYDNSSRKYKKNIRTLKDDFYKILAVECKTYTRPGFPNHQEIGCIAEEFHNAGLNHLVFYDENDLPDGINYEKISLYLLEILKGQCSKAQ